MNFAAALAAADSRRDDVDALDTLARAALDEGEEEAALGRLIEAAERSREALLWQWVGLLQRSLDENEAAIGSFAEAARLAPDDAGIAHGRARVALEAGLDAVDLFLRARSLAPRDGSVLLGLAAARLAVGEGREAAVELTQTLERAPGWIEGYEQLAQLLSLTGAREEATVALELALLRFPRQPDLWTTLFAIDLRREDYRALERDVARAAAAGMTEEVLAFYRAVVAGELSQELFPPALFEAAPASVAKGLALWRIRHLLRLGAIEAALPLIDAELGSARAKETWPYAATAWRLAGDERSDWLEGDERFVQLLDIRPDLPELAAIADHLRGLHVAQAEYLDQSVRGGTQTDGPLLSRIEPPIRKLRSAIVAAVGRYIRQLPQADPTHPLLAHRRDRRVRFSGSWSVRLRGGGRHANHVHPQGWISSALYIDLPRRAPVERHDSGWFTLGAPPDNLRIDLPPWRKIEPLPGRLVLFPSWMWHGTVPFEAGERLTVAFDVRPPI